MWRSGHVGLDSIQAEIQNNLYAIIGIAIISNLALIASAITGVIKFFVKHSLMQREIGKISTQYSELKKDLDALHAKIRNIKP